MGASRMRQPPLDQDYDLLPPPPKTRAALRRPVAGNDAVSDAHFVVIAEIGPRRLFGATLSGEGGAGSTGLSRIAAYAAWATRGIEALLERLSDRAFAVLVALIFGAVFMFAGGVIGLARQAPPMQSAALEFSHVSLTPQDANGMRVLLINGIIENNAGGRRNVPPIRADLFSDGRLAASIVIDPPASDIAGGQSRGFAARIQHPGGKTPDLQLSFVPADAI